jgi:uncharacterized membrane protein YozB (DUF420 family)
MRDHRFFVVLSGLLLLFVLAGFAPTFYLRPVEGVAQLPPAQQVLPWHVHLHGLLMTAWYVIVPVQGLLAQTGRRQAHRTLGLTAFALALVIPVLAVMTVIRFVKRYPLGGFPMPPEVVPMIVAGDLVSIVLFIALVAGAFGFRRQPETHRRLILFASIVFVGPALARIDTNFALGWPGFAPLASLALGLSLVVHDAVTARRIHRATKWGFALILAGTVVGGAIGVSPLGQSITDAIAQAEAPLRPSVFVVPH